MISVMIRRTSVSLATIDSELNLCYYTSKNTCTQESQLMVQLTKFPRRREEWHNYLRFLLSKALQKTRQFIFV